MLKRIGKSDWAISAAAFVINAYLRLVYRTARRVIEGEDHLKAAHARKSGAIFIFWHGRMMMAADARRSLNRAFWMLISTHRDGELIARAVAPLRVGLIRGSTINRDKTDQQKGAISASGQILRAVRRGDFIGITPDGPRGPAEKTHIGLIKLASLANAPVIPVGFSARPAGAMSSWDRFLLALPFCRAAWVFGAPIDLERARSPARLEADRQKVEKALQDATARADALVGRSALRRTDR